MVSFICLYSELSSVFIIHKHSEGFNSNIFLNFFPSYLKTKNKHYIVVQRNDSWRLIVVTKAEILKTEILKKYRSVRQFALDMNIPYSTLVTALDRGIEGMAYGTVIRMCDKLSLNPIDFSSLDRDTSVSEQLLENRVMQYYTKLNKEGREKVLDLMDDFVQMKKYKTK